MCWQVMEMGEIKMNPHHLHELAHLACSSPGKCMEKWLSQLC